MTTVTSHGLKPFYFTFGSNTNLRNNYVCIMARTAGEARQEMFNKQGTLWGFQYDDELDFQRQIKEYGLTEVPLGTECVRER
jgi:hypothetical protein